MDRRGRATVLSPKGRFISAQGNALGIKERSPPQDLKGRANQNQCHNRYHVRTSIESFSRRTGLITTNDMCGIEARSWVAPLGLNLNPTRKGW